MAQIVRGGSSRAVWPHTNPETYGDSWDDKIADDGTDYLGKSFSEHALSYPAVVNSIESSELLRDIVVNMSKSFGAFEQRMNDIIDQIFAETQEFDGALGNAIVNIGKSVDAVNDRIDHLEHVDSVAKSMNGGAAYFNRGNVGFINKSGFGGNTGPSKDEILEALVKGVEAGQFEPRDVIKFETTGELGEHVAKSLNLN